MKTIKIQPEQPYINLKKQLVNKANEDLTWFISELKKETTVKDIHDKWYYKQLLTFAKKRSLITVKELKAYLVEKETAHKTKDLLKDFARMNEIFVAPKLISIDISVEWKSNRTWGANPTATANVNAVHSWNRYESGSIGGCGYDKCSTAVARAINQALPVLKMLYDIKEKHAKLKNQEVFSYGSGYGILPYFEGGVGVSCYPDIFKKCGYLFRNTGSGKMFDVYTVTPL